MQAWNVARHSTADVVEQSSRNPAADHHPLVHDPCFVQQNPLFHASDHSIFSPIEREDDGLHGIFGGLSDIYHHHPQDPTLEKTPISSTFVHRREKSRGESSGTKREPQELHQIQEAPTEVCANKRRRKTPRPAQTRRTSAEMHNAYEKKRRDRITEKIRTLRDLMPNCSSSNAASILDHAIEYLKDMKLQIQTMKDMSRTATYQYPWMTPQWMDNEPPQPGALSPFLSFARPSPGMSSVPQSVTIPSSNLDPSPSSGGGDNVPVPQMQVSPICSQPLLTALLLYGNNGSSANNSGDSMTNISQDMLK